MILHSANSKKRLKSKKAICSIILPNSRMTWPSSTFNLVFPSIFRWKMSLTGLFYPLATLGNKIKPLKAHLPTQYWWKNKISSGKRSRHSEFGKIIEQSTISKFPHWHKLMITVFIIFTYILCKISKLVFDISIVSKKKRQLNMSVSDLLSVSLSVSRLN